MPMIDKIERGDSTYHIDDRHDGMRVDVIEPASMLRVFSITAEEMRPGEEWRDHITANLTDRHWQACGLSCPVLTWGGTCRKDTFERCDGSFGKFDTAAAATLWEWSLDQQPDTCGDAQLGNGWHAFFPDDRAILQTVNSGAVFAWTLPEDQDWDAARAEIEAGAQYMDDDDEYDDEEGCEGHCDTDDALTSGVGIGEAVYCDGTCVPKTAP
jgi:hypothetical protein